MTATELIRMIQDTDGTPDELIEAVIDFSDDFDPYGMRDEYNYDDPDELIRMRTDTRYTLETCRQELIDFLQEIIDDEQALLNYERR